MRPTSNSSHLARIRIKQGQANSRKHPRQLRKHRRLRNHKLGWNSTQAVTEILLLTLTMG
jgi:hypothetical protein